jgi:hypothetical protein
MPGPTRSVEMASVHPAPTRLGSHTASVPPRGAVAGYLPGMVGIDWLAKLI